MAVADRASRPNSLVLEKIRGRRLHGNPENQGKIHHGTGGPDSENELCTRFEASDEHLIGIPLGVLKARDAIAVPFGQMIEATAIEEMHTPW